MGGKATQRVVADHAKDLPTDGKPRTIRDIAQHMTDFNGRALATNTQYVRRMIADGLLEPVAGHAHKPCDYWGGNGAVCMTHASVQNRYVVKT